MAKIKSIQAREIIDSSGNPTIEGVMILDNGIYVTTSIPAGISIGKYEALELRDNDHTRFDGLGVLTAVSYINDIIAPKLIGFNPGSQSEIDNWLIKADATLNKSRLGANTILTISQLVAKAAAADLSMPLFRYINKLYSDYYKNNIPIIKIPTPIFSIINGGKYANSNLDFQEFEIITTSSLSFTDALIRSIEIFHELKKMLLYRNASVSLGEEGGFTPNLLTNGDALEVISETIKQKNYTLGLDIFLGLDMAASHYYKEERYLIKDKSGPLQRQEYLEFIKKMIKEYSFLVIEDPLNQDDWEGWKKLNSLISKETYLVGDDFICSSKERILRAIKEKACTSILIKPNQVGTITECLEVINIAKTNNISFIISQRSAETNDDFIADFSVGIGADFVKFGAPARGERVAKYNRLWQIEKHQLKS